MNVFMTFYGTFMVFQDKMVHFWPYGAKFHLQQHLLFHFFDDTDVRAGGRTFSEVLALTSSYKLEFCADF